MGMHITLTDEAGLFPLVVPIVPNGLKVLTESENSDFKTTKAYYRIFGIKKNKSVQWSSVFPVDKDYDFAEPFAVRNGWIIHTFIKTKQDTSQPLRCVITTDTKKTVFNELVSVDEYEFIENGAKDIEYRIKLTEFKPK